MSALGILNAGEIAEALRTGMPQLVEVGTAKDFGAAIAATLRYPSAFVIPLNEQPGPNRYQNHLVLDQKVLCRFGVIWAVRDIGDRTRSKGLDDITAVRSAGMAILGGLVLSGAETTCVPVSGRLISGIDKKGQMLWQDDFTVSFNRRLTTQP